MMEADARGAVEEQIKELASRCAHLEQRVDALTSLAANLMAEIASVAPDRYAPPAEPGLEQPVHAPVPTAAVHAKRGVSAGIARVIQLIHRGETAAAQKLLRSVPQKELAEQPASVALVAAALCIERGDFQAALKALGRARQLTDEARLLKVIELVEAQAR
jgi:hypothetical protein